MNDFQVIPAIDILNKECVRLYQGDYNQSTTYYKQPELVAKKWENEGAKAIHIVDLNGAKNGSPVNLDVIKKIIETIKIPIQLGGGLRDIETIKKILDIGVSRAIIGSAIFDNPQLLENIFNTIDPQKIVAGIDIKEDKPAIHGWTNTINMSIENLFENLEKKGIKRFIVTDITKDGTLKGPNIELLSKIAQKVTVPIIASGGISEVNDIINLSKIPNIEGCITGKALYERKIIFSQLPVLQAK